MIGVPEKKEVEDPNAYSREASFYILHLLSLSLSIAC